MLVDYYDELIRDYYLKNNLGGVVLGISGGKDSTVVAMLAKKVWGDNVFGVLMPNGEQNDLADSLSIVKTLNIKHRIVNIEAIYNNLIHAIEDQVVDGYSGFVENCPKITEKAKTNIPPRIRMAALYAVAQTLGYRVIGTGNASEAYIGWTTKWGDSAYDLNPIYNLTCGQVVEIGKILAEEFGLDEKYVNKTPSDGLTGKSDEENFGFTYADLDKWVLGARCLPAETVQKIKKLHELSAHKRKMPEYFGG